jgi:hypothetical protein
MSPAGAAAALALTQSSGTAAHLQLHTIGLSDRMEAGTPDDRGHV